MSRSKKLDIIKDRPRNSKKSSIYWRKIRRFINIQIVKYLKGNSVILDKSIHKSVMNDYDYSDYTIVKSYIKGVWK